jgi:hypothetical protein
MARRRIALPRTPGQWDLEFVSHGRRGPSAGWGLSPSQVEEVKRTVRRVPEVVVKVSGGARDADGARAHFDYIDRHGKQAIVTDDGRELLGRGAAAELVSDWNLELSRGQYQPKPLQGERDPRPKTVHNIVLSMPGHTSPEAVLAAARTFARENFALQYRYAMVLHTDQKHPHVHLVVKAEHEFEPRKRLHITKAMLRDWREQFAACLRAQGVAANATPASVRGHLRMTKKDPIHHRLKDMRAFDRLPTIARAGRRPPKESTFMRAKVEAVARELRSGGLAPEAVKDDLLAARHAIEADWRTTAQLLRTYGEEDLARELESFVRAMPPVRTEKERIAAGLMAEMEAQRRLAEFGRS